MARSVLGSRCFHHVEKGSHGSLALCKEEELRGGHMKIAGGDKTSPEDGHDLAGSVFAFSDKL